MPLDSRQRHVRPPNSREHTDFVSESSLNADFTSDPIDTQDMERGSFEVRWTGNAGTGLAFNLQISARADAPDAEWTDWGGAEGAFSSISDTSGARLWELEGLQARYFRLRAFLADSPELSTLVGHYHLRAT